MKTKKSLDHLAIGILFAVLGTLLGILLIELYHISKNHKPGVFWFLFEKPEFRNNLIILSQVPNVLVFFSFFQTKRDRSAYGALLVIILAIIPVVIGELF